MTYFCSYKHDIFFVQLGSQDRKKIFKVKLEIQKFQFWQLWSFVVQFYGHSSSECYSHHLHAAKHNYSNYIHDSRHCNDLLHTVVSKVGLVHSQVCFRTNQHTTSCQTWSTTGGPSGSAPLPSQVKS